MPPDVFLMLASSGIAFVASLMFFVSDDSPPRPLSGPLMSFSLPPLRPPSMPPPPTAGHAPPESEGYGYQASWGGMRYHLHLSYECETGQWLVDLDYEPLADSPALRIESAPGPLHGSGQVHDLRWDGRAGVARRARARWRKPPADA